MLNNKLLKILSLTGLSLTLAACAGDGSMSAQQQAPVKKLSTHSQTLTHEGETFYSCPTAGEIRDHLGSFHWSNLHGISWGMDNDHAPDLNKQSKFHLYQVLKTRHSIECYYELEPSGGWFKTSLQLSAFDKAEFGGYHWDKCKSSDCQYNCKAFKEDMCPFKLVDAKGNRPQHD